NCFLKLFYFSFKVGNVVHCKFDFTIHFRFFHLVFTPLYFLIKDIDASAECSNCLFHYTAFLDSKYSIKLSWCASKIFLAVVTSTEFPLNFFLSVWFPTSL